MRIDRKRKLPATTFMMALPDVDLPSGTWTLALKNLKR